MKFSDFEVFCCSLLVLLASSAYVSAAAPLLNDRAIMINAARDVAGRRQALIRYICGAEGWPARRMPTSIR